MAKNDDLTNTQIKEFNRKFERGEKPREDLRTYSLPTSDSSGGAASEADKKLKRLDKDASVSDKVLFLASRLASI